MFKKIISAASETIINESALLEIWASLPSGESIGNKEIKKAALKAATTIVDKFLTTGNINDLLIEGFYNLIPDVIRKEIFFNHPKLKKACQSLSPLSKKVLANNFNDQLRLNENILNKIPDFEEKVRLLMLNDLKMALLDKKPVNEGIILKSLEALKLIKSRKNTSAEYTRMTKSIIYAIEIENLSIGQCIKELSKSKAEFFPGRTLRDSSAIVSARDSVLVESIFRKLHELLKEEGPDKAKPAAKLLIESGIPTEYKIMILEAVESQAKSRTFYISDLISFVIEHLCAGLKKNPDYPEIIENLIKFISLTLEEGCHFKNFPGILLAIAEANNSFTIIPAVIPKFEKYITNNRANYNNYLHKYLDNTDVRSSLKQEESEDFILSMSMLPASQEYLSIKLLTYFSLKMFMEKKYDLLRAVKENLKTYAYFPGRY